MEEVLINNKNDLNTIKSILDTLTNKYSVAIQDLISMQTSVEDRNTKFERIQEICLDAAQDLTVLSAFKISNPTSYYLKFLEPALTYLRELRQTLSLYVNTERI